MSYSGGQCTTNNDGSLSTSGYTSSSYSTYGAYNYFFWGTKNNGTQTTTSSVTCAGEITATFTWIPDDPNDPNDVAPAQAVVRETSSGKWWSYSSPSAFAVGLSDNDLSDETSSFPYVPGGTTSPNASQANPHGVSQGTRYKIQEEAGASFTVKCSPDSTASGTGSLNPAGSGYGMVEVSYSASAEPLEVVLQGGIGEKDAKKFLIGQKVTAYTSTGELTANSHLWGVSGGEPFKNWTANTSQTTFAALATETDSQTTFYFRKPLFGGLKATISCAFNLAVPTGAKPAGGLTVVLNRQCSVDKPLNSLEVYTGSTQGIPNPANPQGMEFTGYSYSGVSVGIAWIGIVETPMEYGFGGGWNYTQLITPYRAQRISGVWHGLTINYTKVLDNTFGYDPVEPSRYTDDGIEWSANDSPREPFEANASHVKVLDSFVTYTMYCPPGEDSRFVPLKNLSWFWQGEAQPNTSGIWQLSNTGGGWQFLSDFPTHPMWNGNWTDGQMTPPLP